MYTFVMKVERECCVSIEVLMFRFCEVASEGLNILLFTYNKTAKTEKTERFIESINCKDKLQSS